MHCRPEARLVFRTFFVAAGQPPSGQSRIHTCKPSIALGRERSLSPSIHKTDLDIVLLDNNAKLGLICARTSATRSFVHSCIATAWAGCKIGCE
jgi:hypothetical protein